jgi:hypothetical protein
MNTALEAVAGWLRGPTVSRVLRGLGIDPKQYWLLMDLFDQLSDRGEVLDQLGRQGYALKAAALLYLVMSALLALIAFAAKPSFAVYSATVLSVTAVTVFAILMSEAANSLVNPAEGMVLAHQPINGATYTAAKLTHLARIVLYLTPALNGLPALATLGLRDSRWHHPILLFSAALAIGFLQGLFCCSLFGWLLRFVPVRRLKAAAQMASAAPFLLMMWGPDALKAAARMGLSPLLPGSSAARWGLAAAAAIVAAMLTVAGLRALSFDYLIRVSSLTRGGPAPRTGAGRSRIGELVARLAGGPAARAGFAFVGRMMLRDWQFRRQSLVVLVFGAIGVVRLLWRAGDPFSSAFTHAHFVPHLLGVMLFSVALVLASSDDHQGALIFLLVPQPLILPFARGVHALLWLVFVLAPQLLLLPVLTASWGLPHAALFAAYNLAVGSLYAALMPRLIGAAPFSKPYDPQRGAIVLPVLIASGLATAAAAALQYFFLFRSLPAVLGATVVLGAAAAIATPHSIAAYADSIRFHLGLAASESGNIYREVDA